jgi:hypothetical protein
LVEIEELLGDSSRVIRSDIWDALRSHIEAVEGKFLAEADLLPDQLAAIETEAERMVRR